MMDKAKSFKLLGSLILPTGLGSIAEIFRAKEIPGCHATLNRPSFNPPHYLFSPVWTALYTLMGVSMFLKWNTPKIEMRQNALTVFGVQLFFISGGVFYSFPFTQFYFH